MGTMNCRIVSSWPNMVILGLYLPFGLVLLLLRFFMSFHVFLVSSFLRRYEVTRYLLRFMSGVLGGVVCVRSEEKAAQEKAIPIVSNHVSLMDHLAVNLCVPCFTAQENLFSWYFGNKTVNLKEPSAEDRKIINDEEEPLHLLPERLPSGNHRTVYQFDHELFAALDKAQPVAIEVRRPLPINLVCHPLSPWRELLWQLFCAVTVYHVTFLPPVTRREEESSEAFAARVRSALVSALQATAADELLEKVVARNRAQRDNAKRRRYEVRPTPSVKRISRLVQQVKEVLPDTEERVIQAELERTGDVDATITNILEGRVKVPPPKATVAPSTFNTSARRFGKSADERHMSFEDRKKAFIENARRRYLEKMASAEEQQQT